MATLRISLANKCQLLFGAAVVLILTAALAVPWFRMQTLVDEGQREIARVMADAWLMEELGPAGGGLPGWEELPPLAPQVLGSAGEREGRMRLILESRFETEGGRDAFLARAIRRFRGEPGQASLLHKEPTGERPMGYRYAQAVRKRDLQRMTAGASEMPAPDVANPLLGVVLIDMNADWARSQVLLNRVYIVIAGLLAGVLAIATFWFITTRIILSPVRVLRSTAERVAAGELNIRADVNTGDEYEQLSDAFNDMLTHLKRSQEQLRSLNKQLDLKLGELAKTNVSLYEANRLKTDFLTNVSHELRTPLNSIIGFAEVLADDPKLDDKRQRFIRHIIDSSRSLLALINDLLDLAKIEAGRVDLKVEPMSVADACEALAGLIRPQAEARRQALSVRVAPGSPTIETDAGKMQQVLFNFLSNAVKFTPEEGRVELGAEPTLDSEGVATGVRVWVSDNGPGIAPEDHEKVFDKFRQLDEGHTKAHGGTGLGLAISRELARLLQGRIELQSAPGAGATFALVLPLKLETRGEPLMPEASAG